MTWKSPLEVPARFGNGPGNGRLDRPRLVMFSAALRLAADHHPLERVRPGGIGPELRLRPVGPRSPGRWRR